MSSTSPLSRSGKSLANVGGALGIAGTFIGIAIFVLGCFGVQAGFALSPIPLILGSVGLILGIVGGFEKHPPEDPHVLAAIVINIAVISGALLEMAVWLGWTFFAGGSSGHV